jgi:nicotinamide mononucleotide adenylyltransferase
MCTLAADETNTWLMVDAWEAFQSYQRTAVVLDHFDYEINHRFGGVYTEDGEHRNVRVMLLAGSDLIATMSAPGVWSYADVRSLLLQFTSPIYPCFQLDHILGRYGAFVIERAGNGLEQAIDNLQRWRSNIHLISQLIQNDVSSTKVRLCDVIHRP